MTSGFLIGGNHRIQSNAKFANKTGAKFGQTAVSMFSELKQKVSSWDYAADPSIT